MRDLLYEKGGFKGGEILSCQHCQVTEDSDIVWGAGEPIWFCDLLSEGLKNSCPNCQAKLSETDFVLIGIDYHPVSYSEQAMAVYERR